KELDEARKQGEVYARELAAMFDRGEEVAAESTLPPAPGVSSEARFSALTRLCAGVSTELQAVLSPLSKDAAPMRPHEVTEESLQKLRRRLGHAHEVVAALASIGQIRPDELYTEVDLAEAARSAVRGVSAAAERDEVKVGVQVVPEGSLVYVRRGPKALAAL